VELIVTTSRGLSLILAEELCRLIGVDQQQLVPDEKGVVTIPEASLAIAYRVCCGRVWPIVSWRCCIDSRRKTRRRSIVACDSSIGPSIFPRDRAWPLISWVGATRCPIPTSAR
jgi:hypothetical protein